jgi:glyoxylase-like metal-dependent hydrolase (beta-lactamase superfamily II)
MFPQKLAENILVLGQPNFQSYLVRGKRSSALIEMGMTSTADTLIGQLSELGVSPDYLIVTHPHSDHVCGLTALRQAFPFSGVIAGEGAEEFLDHPKVAAATLLEDRHVAAGMTIPAIVSGRHPITAAPTLWGCRAVPDGAELDLGEMKIRFLAVKGHSPGNIVVHIPGINMLLASDSLGYLYPEHGFFPIFFTGYADYMATIRRLGALDPAILGLAHNGFFVQAPAVRKAFQTAITAAESVRDRVQKDKRAEKAIAQDLFRHYYHDELAIFSPENILGCCRLLVHRVREEQ